VLADPSISVHLADWPREGDHGLVAEEATAPPIGAAWWRRFTAERRGHGFVSETIPELTIAVRAGECGRGIGSSLLNALLDEARARDLPALASACPSGTRRDGWYERAGFACVERVGESWTMVYGLG
jgi:GNAT superfamily N-acetyltransferase